MKTLLDCDAAFEALTSGCNAVREDEDLREHLEGCAECRQLAEAISPAAERLEIEIQAEDSRHAGAMALANTVFARLDAERTAVLVESHRRSFLYLSGHAWSQLGAAAAILLALGGLFWAASPRDSAVQLAALPAFTSPMIQGTEPTKHGLLHLASLQLPGNCLPTAAGSQDAAALFQCCTRCHHSGELLPAVRLVAFSQQSCVACHKS
jgi:hypothetical protein